MIMVKFIIIQLIYNVRYRFESITLHKKKQIRLYVTIEYTSVNYFKFICDEKNAYIIKWTLTCQKILLIKCQKH